MGKVYLLSDMSDVPFAIFTSIKALFEYHDTNWHPLLCGLNPKRIDKSEEIFSGDVSRVKYPSASAMVQDTGTFHLEGTSLVASTEETIAKFFRGKPGQLVVMQDSTGTIKWKIRNFETLSAKRK